MNDEHNRMKIYTKVIDNGRYNETYLYLCTGKAWHNGPICIGKKNDIKALREAFNAFIEKLSVQDELYVELKSKVDPNTRLFFFGSVRESTTLIDAYELFKKEKHVKMIPFSEFEILFNDYKKYINATS